MSTTPADEPVKPNDADQNQSLAQTPLADLARYFDPRPRAQRLANDFLDALLTPAMESVLTRVSESDQGKIMAFFNDVREALVEGRPAAETPGHALANQLLNFWDSTHPLRATLIGEGGRALWRGSFGETGVGKFLGQSGPSPAKEFIKPNQKADAFHWNRKPEYYFCPVNTLNISQLAYLAGFATLEPPRPFRKEGKNFVFDSKDKDPEQGFTGDEIKALNARLNSLCFRKVQDQNLIAVADGIIEGKQRG